MTLESLVRVLLGLLAVSFLPRQQANVYARAQFLRSHLALPELRMLYKTDALAGHSPLQAVSWARTHGHGARAVLGADGRTIVVRFPSGIGVAIVGRRLTATALRNARPSYRAFRPALRLHADAGSPRAIVLEPFAAELGLGANAGGPEVDALSSAGYSVDVKRNTDVTIPVMERLGGYSVVYMETHSGLLPSGDAIVAVDETNFGPYAALAPVGSGGDGSLLPTLVAGDPTHSFYVSFTSTFVKLHVQPFPADTIMFLNGCSLLHAPAFWTALHDKGVATMLSWDGDADVAGTEPAAAYVTKQWSLGKTVSQSVDAATNIGLGTIPTFPPAHLGFLGNGDERLQPSTPTPTPLPPTVTPAVTSTPVSATPSPTASGSHRSGGVTRQIGAYLAALAARGQLSGAVLIARGGRPLLSKGYGMAVRQTGLPNSPATRFPVGGVTGSLSILGVLRLEDAGRVRDTASICAYVSPCLASWRPITVRMLLAGTAHLPRYRPGRSGVTIGQAIHLLQRQRPVRVPRSTISYGNGDELVLGAIIERATGRSWSDYLRSVVFGPAGMSHSGRLSDSLLPPGRAQGYSGNHIDTRAVYNDSFQAYSTATDVYRYDSALFGGKLLSRASSRRIFAPRGAPPHPDAGVGGTHWGYQWKVGTVSHHRVLYTTGSTNSFTTVNIEVPAAGVSVVVISNDARNPVERIAIHLTHMALH